MAQFLYIAVYYVHINVDKRQHKRANGTAKKGKVAHNMMCKVAKVIIILFQNASKDVGLLEGSEQSQD